MNTCQLPIQLSFIKANRKSQLSPEDVLRTLKSHSDNFPAVFYLLSESNQVLYAQTYLQSFLYSNLSSFSEEQLYYLVEGIKNQIALKLEDFFIVMHRFFSIPLLRHRPVQGLLLHLLQSFDYRMRELLITTDLIPGLFTEENLVGADPTFYLKLLRVLIESENDVFLGFLEGLAIKIRIPEPVGCRKYFKEWYEDLSLVKKRIRIEFY